MDRPETPLLPAGLRQPADNVRVGEWEGAPAPRKSETPRGPCGCRGALGFAGLTLPSLPKSMGSRAGNVNRSDPKGAMP